MDLIVVGERVELRVERAVRWGRTLLVADLHWGKSAAFRAWGLPVPDELVTDLDRLGALVRATDARRVVVLGDLVHARASLTPAVVDAVTAFRVAHPVELVLVQGNHDRHVEALPAAWGIAVVPVLGDGPFQFRHHPEPGDAYVWAGHLHPGIALGRATDRVRLPCFHVGPRVGILPAFGGFTGLAGVRPRAGDTVVAIVPGRDGLPGTLYRVDLDRDRRVGRDAGRP